MAKSIGRTIGAASSRFSHLPPVNEIDPTESERATKQASGDQSGSTNFAVLTTCDRFIFLSEHRGHAAPPEEAREVNDQDERRQDVAAPGTQSTDGALSPQFS